MKIYSKLFFASNTKCVILFPIKTKIKIRSFMKKEKKNKKYSKLK